MAASTTSGWRRALAAVLVIALTLAGVGRAVAAVAPPADAVPGIHGPICHSGPGPATDPAEPAPQDCCDGCALLAPAVLPAPPSVSRPAPAALAVSLLAAATTVPAAARPRGPHRSRGPPAA